MLEPEEILRLTPAEADGLLDRLEASVPVHPPLIRIPPRGATEALVFGDTHGDWRSAQALVRRYRDPSGPRVLVGLGDYVDRPPQDCPQGSVANALYLLELVAERPSSVFLVRGNHETVNELGVLPHHLPEEVDELWGPEVDRYARIVGLLGRGPLAATLPNGAYLAHAGFPRRRVPGPWTDLFEATTEADLLDLVWAECGASSLRRGVAAPFDEAELDHFLSTAGLQVFLRGHDPDLAGRSVFGARCLTLHTTRVFERYGGVLVARLPLDRPIGSTKDLTIEHLETEGQQFRLRD